MANPLVKQLVFQNFDDGAYLSVPPSVKGKIRLEDVKEELYGRKIVNANFERIAAVLKEASGEFRWIGERFRKYEKIKDKYIYVRVAEDGVKALLTVRFPQDSQIQITLGDLEYKLWEAKIRVPWDREKLQRIVNEKKTVINEMVAEGRPPVHGENARLTFHVDLTKSTRPLIREDGSVDYRRIKTIHIVEKDQLLVTKTPAKEGQPGLSVFGEPIPYRPGKDLKLPRGINTYVSPDDLHLHAKISGHAYMEGGLIHIESVYVVKNDVDFSVGDIDYIGNVIVNGDVKTGFTVKTKGDILVRGNVDGATLISEEGDIVIDGGVFGKHKAYLKARGDIRADFIQHARLEAGGDIEVNKYILSSELTARGFIRIPRGSIIGGKLQSDRGIVAKIIGSPNNQKTLVAVGRPIEQKLWLEALAINKEIKGLEKQLQKIEKQLQFFEVLERRLKKLPEDKQHEVEELLQEQEELRRQMNELIRQRDEVLGLGDEWLEHTPFIQANFRIFPGVVINMNQFREEITRKLHSVKYLMRATGVEKKVLA